MGSTKTKVKLNEKMLGKHVAKRLPYKRGRIFLWYNRIPVKQANKHAPNMQVKRSRSSLNTTDNRDCEELKINMCCGADLRVVLSLCF